MSFFENTRKPAGFGGRVMDDEPVPQSHGPLGLPVPEACR